MRKEEKGQGKCFIFPVLPFYSSFFYFFIKDFRFLILYSRISMFSSFIYLSYGYPRSYCLSFSFFSLPYSYHPLSYPPFPTFSSLSISSPTLLFLFSPLISPLFILHSYLYPLSPLIHVLPRLINHFPTIIHLFPSSMALSYFPSLSTPFPHP